MSPTTKNHCSPEATLIKVNSAEVNERKFKSYVPAYAYGFK